MRARRSQLVTALLVVCIAAMGVGGGAYVVSRERAATDAKLDALRSEMGRRLVALDPARDAVPAGTAGQNGAGIAAPDISAAGAAHDERASIIETVKRELQHEMGLVPLELVRARRDSFVELYTYDSDGGSSYGTAGYLGDGYFITVKHGVVPLDQGPGEPARRRIESIKLIYGRRAVAATVVDAGDAEVEVDPGDWAILRATEPVDLEPLPIDLSYDFDFADPIVRLGNDYSKGVILATGHVGQRTPNGLVTCLTDGHPGVSGGGVLDKKGDLVGVPVGRMQGDYRFSFILPLRAEMFRRVPVARRGQRPSAD